MGEGSGNDYVRFSRSAGQRIAKAVIAVENGSRDQEALTFLPALGVPAKTFRMGTYGTASWAVDTSKTVTFLSSTNTATVYNVFGALPTAASSRQVAFAKDGTAWYLLQARCP